MPYYDYRCEGCGEKFTVRAHMHDEPIKVCPKCGQEAVKRIMSATSFTIKGMSCSCNTPSQSQESPCCQHCPHRA